MSRACGRFSPSSSTRTSSRLWQSSSSGCRRASFPVIELRPTTPEVLEAVLDGDRDRAAQALDLELPEEVVREGTRRFFELRLRQMLEESRFREGCPPAVVLEGAMIGHAGSHGPPGVNAK